MNEQDIVAETVRAHFGEESLNSVLERGIRFLEESIELFQAAGGFEDVAQLLVRYVYGRPKGDPAQEIGGVGVTLMALAESLKLNAEVCVTEEVTRFSTLPSDYFRERHEAKFQAGVSTISTE